MDEFLTSSSKRKIRNTLIGTVAIVLIAALFLGIQWATYARPPLPAAQAAAESDDQVTVSSEPWLTFTPVENPDGLGFIFYPGGRINPAGYSTLMRTIAQEGYLVIVPEFPINMAVFDADAADDIIAHYPSIDTWVIAGHSVGGTMAAQYTHNHPENIDGLMIWASYPASNADLSDSSIPVVSIYGSLDPQVNDASINETKHLLPADTEYVRIERGDHHQFGSYEIKPEEDHAEISRSSQHDQIIDSVLSLLNKLSARQ